MASKAAANGDQPPSPPGEAAEEQPQEVAAAEEQPQEAAVAAAAEEPQEEEAAEETQEDEAAEEETREDEMEAEEAAEVPGNGKAPDDEQKVEPAKEDEGFKRRSSDISFGGSSPGKIFVGGLPKETTQAGFTKHFDKYGEIIDSVIMKDRRSGHPRGFGFITFADPSVVDKVIEDAHVFSGKTVEIKRTIPRGAIGSKDFKTKKIFVGGIPTTVTEDELKSFFAKFGEVKEHMIMKDHSTNRSRGFGFVSFATEQAVDDLLTKGNKIDFNGVQVEIKKAEPKSLTNPRPPSSKHFGDSRRASSGPFRASGAGSYMAAGGFGRSGAYGGYGSDFDGAYRGYGNTAIGAYRGESSLGYPGRYGGGFGRDYDLSGYDGPSEGYGIYSGQGPPRAGYGGLYRDSNDSFYGQGGYGGSAGGRYHPYFG